MVDDQGFKNASINLDEPRSIYYAGQVLNGNVTIELSRPLEVSAVNINYIGEAQVFWTEDEYEEYNGVRRNIRVKYQGQETYFNVIECIAGGMGGMPVNIPPGVNKIPFKFQIPYIAPSSFNDKRGSVYYKVVLYVEYPDPSKERDQIEKTLEVVAPLDLNKEDIEVPWNMEFEELYSCCCSSSPMNINISLPHSGFCPGQTIPITVKADNDSSAEVASIVLQLIKKVCFHSKVPKSDYIPPEEVLETVKTKPIMGNSKQETTYYMVVPDMIAPNLQNCSIIDVGFFIKVTIKLSGCNDDLEDDTEICIGLIPIESTVKNEPYKHPLHSDLPQGPLPDPTAAPAVISHPTAMPVAGYPSPQPMRTAYPTASAYLGSPYPVVTTSPQNTYPCGPKSVNNVEDIGFVVPNTPPGHNAPYPPTTPYPSNVGYTSYPTDNSPSAPPPSR